MNVRLFWNAPPKETGTDETAYPKNEGRLSKKRGYFLGPERKAHTSSGQGAG